MAMAMCYAISLVYMYLLALFITIFFLRACRLFLLIKIRGRESTHRNTNIIDRKTGTILYDNDMKKQQHHLSIDIFSTRGVSNNKNKEIGSNFASEKERRDHLNELYRTLRNLVPPARNKVLCDRASVVGDTIGHIIELVGTIEMLKPLVFNKNHKFKQEVDTVTGIKLEGRNMRLQPFGNVHSDDLSTVAISVKRKCKSCKAKVRFNVEEATIKMVQKDKINWLPVVSKVLDELQLDLHHVVAFQVHNYSRYLFKTKKISEGASVCASDIARKLIEVLGGRDVATLNGKHLVS